MTTAIVLDATTLSLRIVLGEAKVTTDGSISGSYSDHIGGASFGPARLIASASNGVTAVDIVSGIAAPNSRSVKIRYTNLDTVQHTVTLSLYNTVGPVNTIIHDLLVLLPKESIGNEDGNWVALDVNGNRKEATASNFTNITASGTLGVTGTSTLTGNTTVGGTLGVTGLTSVAAITASGLVTMAMDNLTINVGATTYISTNHNGSGTAPNAAVAILNVRADSVTSRSINAGGTVNTGGNDYAEYERKARVTDVFFSGEVVGFDANGLLTNLWAEAISFAVKSTKPSFVGGDNWASHLGEMPPKPAAIDNSASDAEKTAYSIALAKYKQDKDIFNTALSEAEKWVEIIAYCGKTPVNVLGAKPGQYIDAVAVKDGIGGVATDVPSPNTVGRVRRILPDGRAEIAVR